MLVKGRFDQRMTVLCGLGISCVSLHSYRYVWAERALKCGYRDRFARQALERNSKAVHHAYSKHAEVTVPSLDERKSVCSTVESRRRYF